MAGPRFTGRTVLRRISGHFAKNIKTHYKRTRTGMKEKNDRLPLLKNDRGTSGK